MVPRDVTTTASMLERAGQAAARAFAASAERPVVPDPDALDALEDRFVAGQLDEPLTPDDAIGLLEEVGGPATVVQGDGRYFGFVNGGVVPAARAAAMLAAAWDQNAALAVMSPLGVRLDELVGRWLVDLLGLPDGAVASLCGGTSVANLTATLTARDELLRRVGWDVAADGMVGAPQVRVVASTELHSSMAKALRLAGLGRASTEHVPTDETGALDADQLPDDLGDGRPTLVVLQAGNVTTGAHDPFDAVIDAVNRESSWVHVDGAFGLWAAASPRLSGTVRGVERADSWAVDGHKTLNAPYDSAATIVRDADALRRTMSMDASYAAAGGDHAPMNLGLQMSQQARGIPLWAALVTLGRDGVAAMVDHLHALAVRAGDQLSAAGATVVAPVTFNQCPVSFGEDRTTDAVLRTVQAGGAVWLGGTTWHGRRVARISVCDAATDADAIDRLVDRLLAAWSHDRAVD